LDFFHNPDDIVSTASLLPIETFLARQQIAVTRIDALTGDASDRRYFRAVPAEGDPFVLALHASPFDASTLPFLNVRELFAEMPVPVPGILAHAGDLGVLALEDLGDLTLQAHLETASPAEREARYLEAVRHVATIQGRGRELSSPRFVPYGIAFDREKLNWEMDFFVKHFLVAYCGAEFGPDGRERIGTALGELTGALASEPRVVCHRDYHSRNLMVKNGRMYIIDFQDARMGPDTYDLVSLLRDSYVDLPPTLVDVALSYYLDLTGRSGHDRTFRDRFEMMALQRNLKALGTFGFQATTKNNPVYVQYIPRTVQYVRAALQRDSRFSAIAAALSPYVEEWQT
jgi:aminoglycoside/choline kinase family phosphotransferase